MTGGGKILIVNADDLGHTAGINAGIFAAHERGIVTSATLMVGSEAARAAAAGLGRHPELGVGLHVTLTGTRPVSPPDRVPSLVDEQGRFRRYPEAMEAPKREELRAEVRAQLARFRDLTGRLPTHLDSHHHSHRVPVVCEVLIELAGELDLPVRNSSPEVGQWLLRAGIPTTDHFVERFFGEEARVEVLLELLAGLAAGTTELMCHPGRVDAALQSVSTYAEERERELAVLTDPLVAQALREHGIRLASFRSHPAVLASRL